MVRACGEGLCVSFSRVFLVRGLSQIHDRHHVPCHRSVLLEIPLKRTMSPCSIHSSMQSGISVAVLARTFCFRCSAFFCDVVLCFIWRHGRAVLRGYGNYWVSTFLLNSKTNTDYCVAIKWLVPQKAGFGAQSDARPTGDQEVAGWIPVILSWRLIMKSFLRSFSPFR